jgi:hypothetical protein
VKSVLVSERAIPVAIFEIERSIPKLSNPKNYYYSFLG